MFVPKAILTMFNHAYLALTIPTADISSLFHHSSSSLPSPNFENPPVFDHFRDGKPCVFHMIWLYSTMWRLIQGSHLWSLSKYIYILYYILCIYIYITYIWYIYNYIYHNIQRMIFTPKMTNPWLLSSFLQVFPHLQAILPLQDTPRMHHRQQRMLQM